MSPSFPTEFMDEQIVACPKCHGEFIFCRSDAAEIDESGFESYKLECPRCAFPLAGVIDPFDNKLLLSEIWEAS